MTTQEKLKQLRIENHLTAKELSEIFKQNECSISELERGKKNLTIEMLKKYCNKFNQSADYILNIENNIKNIIYEDKNVILYNEKINRNWNNIWINYKIIFKNKIWNKISIHYDQLIIVRKNNETNFYYEEDFCMSKNTNNKTKMNLEIVPTYKNNSIDKNQNFNINEIKLIKLFIYDIKENTNELNIRKKNEIINFLK